MTQISRRSGLVSLSSATLLLASCSRDVFDPAGRIAESQRDIIMISVYLMLVIIVPVMIMIVWFSWRYRKGGGAKYDPKFDHSTALELGIWSVPLLIIIALGALTWSSTHLLDPYRPLDNTHGYSKGALSDEETLTVQVVSMDWKWLFIYPQQGIATVNELVLPVDRQVRFDITSTNMMNGFYVPTLAGMIYAMPGMQSQLHAVLNKSGNWRGLSSNYSGAGFSDMTFDVRGVSEEGFADWVRLVADTGVRLDRQRYLALERPSEKVPVMRFTAVDDDLYRRILERCVRPDQVCMSEMPGMHGTPAKRADPAGEDGAAAKEHMTMTGRHQ
ncbi:ubiquinol oxidase subunit II [Qipengyuania sp. GH25]|uniref:Ubiquinol oxidase subunit 2 n=1 Tax=Qipengyuania pacifica TaxID=2860199 RepID=A0ABS7JK92_9SPHN|nr:ubiquinol oxidase subunit II [Qipengyuania aerophila]MBX7489807.1 ubiquinol oxidase subunit II [Qipengyuania aerophila]